MLDVKKKKLYSPDGWHQGRADDPHPSSSRAGLLDEDESGTPIIIKRWSQHGI
jgi:hypothetical protein